MISLFPILVLSFWLNHLRFRVVFLRVSFSFSRASSVFRFPFVVFVARARISEGSIVFVRVSFFVRLLASCEVTFVGPFVDGHICSVSRVRS